MTLNNQQKINLEIKIHKKRLDEKNRKKIRRSNIGKNNNFKYPKMYGGVVGRKILWNDIQVPDHLSFSIKKRDETALFFKAVEDFVKSGSNVRLIFLDTKVIALDALTYLLALIQKIRWYYGQDAITGTYPLSKNVERVLSSSGFFKILGVRQRKVFNKGAIRYVKYRSDKILLGLHVREINNELLGEDFKLHASVARRIVSALKEAMSNVSWHAYKFKALRSKRMEGRWWVTGYLNVNKNVLSFSFYDCGVGIPKTLVREFGIEFVRKLISLLPLVDPDDGQMIHAAVQLGRTATMEQNRGKGLQDMHHLITIVGEGSLTIHSRRGFYRYDGQSAQVKNFENFIEGTLITWELPLNKVVDKLNDFIDHGGEYDE